MSDMIGRIFNWADTVNDTDLDTVISGLHARRQERIRRRLSHYKPLTDEEHALLYLGQKINAIKAYKWRTGVSGFEAKEVVEYHRNKKGEQQ